MDPADITYEGLAAEYIRRALPGVSHEQALEFAEFLKRHPYVPIDEFVAFIKKWRD